MEQPKIPTLKDSQKPQVKIKGLAAGMSLFDRLKQFKKKDLAFILAGLGTLFMAPLAEHFMMAPESGDGTMQQGWGGKGGSNLFGSGSSPYESGITGLAPGGAIGGGGDVITPLNVRDPSALVMGPGMTQQPPAGSLAPQTPPPTQKEPDLKDALANAAARAAGAATRKAPVPMPKPAMTGSGLRGLGVASGGSSAGAGLAPINSAGLSTNKAAGSNSLSDVRPASNYRGVARGPGKGAGGFEGLKNGAGNASDLFNQKGAAGNLEQAAQVAMPGGNSFGGGNGGAGASDKGPGGNNSNGSKSVGESLEFLRQKQEMEKALDLKWKMKEKRAMFPLELQQEAAKAIVMKGVVEPLAGQMGELMKSAFPQTGSVVSCSSPAPITVKVSDIVSEAACNSQKDPGKYTFAGDRLRSCGGSQGQVYSGCRITQGAGGAAAPTPSETPLGSGDPLSGVNPQQRAATSRADASCTALAGGAGIQARADGNTTDRDNALRLNAQAGAVVTARNALQGGAASCGAPQVSQGMSADGKLSEAEAQLRNALQKLTTQNGGAAAAYVRPEAEITAAAAAITAAEGQIGAAKTALESPVGTPPQAPNAYFTSTENPFGTSGNPSTWYNEFKAAHAPLGTMVTEMKGRVDRLKAVAADVNLAAGPDANTPGVVARSMSAFRSYEASKAVADAEPNAAKTLYNQADTGAKGLNQAARTVLAANLAAAGANGNVAGQVANFVTAGRDTVAPKVQTTDQALLRHADPSSTAGQAAMQGFTGNAQEAARTEVQALGAVVGTAPAQGLRKNAGDILSLVITNLNASRTGQTAPAAAPTQPPAQ
jgi:hypothetical protein